MPTTPSLPEEFTIYALAGLRKDWQAKLARLSRPRRGGARASAPWLLDGSAVAEVDAAAVQLLVALDHSLGARNRRLVITRASSRLMTACGLLGVSSLLQDDGAAGATA